MIMKNTPISPELEKLLSESKPLSQITGANSHCADPHGSEYPIPWDVDSVGEKNASVYAADSTLVCHLFGKDAKRRATLIVEFANQNCVISTTRKD
jgi:hypothetical protein